MDTRRISRYEFFGGLIGCVLGVGGVLLLMHSVTHTSTPNPGDAEEAAGMIGVFLLPIGLMLGTFLGALFGRRLGERDGQSDHE